MYKETISTDIVADPARHQWMLRDVGIHFMHNFVCNIFNRVCLHSFCHLILFGLCSSLFLSLCPSLLLHSSLL